MSVTFVDDIEASLGRTLTEKRKIQVKKWIDRVEGRIRQRVHDLDQRLESPAYAESFKGVVEDVVIRKIHNPQGMRSERIDDYYYDRGTQAKDLWPTDEEWAVLLPSTIGTAFSTRPDFEPGW